MNKEYKRHCPICSKEIMYSSSDSYYQCKKRNTRCNSCAKKGKNNPQYGKISYRKGLILSIEIKRKISMSRKGRPTRIGKKHLESSKAKMSNSHLGRKLSENTKKKISESTIKGWKNPVIRNKKLKVNRWNNISCDKGQLELLENGII